MSGDGGAGPECGEGVCESSCVGGFVDLAARDCECDCGASCCGIECMNVYAHAAGALRGEDGGVRIECESCDLAGRWRRVEEVLGEWFGADGRRGFLECGAHAALDFLCIGCGGCWCDDEVACAGGIEQVGHGALDVVCGDVLEQVARKCGVLRRVCWGIASRELISNAIGEGRGICVGFKCGTIEARDEARLCGSKHVLVEAVRDGAAEFCDCEFGEFGPRIWFAHEHDGGHAHCCGVVE